MVGEQVVLHPLALAQAGQRAAEDDAVQAGQVADDLIGVMIEKGFHGCLLRLDSSRSFLIFAQAA